MEKGQAAREPPRVSVIHQLAFLFLTTGLPSPVQAAEY